MTKHNGWKGAGLAFLLCMATAPLAAQTFETLASFLGPNGNQPYNVTLIQGTDGNLYGTTYSGGANCDSNEGCGTVFEITPAGELTTLYEFFCEPSDCSDGKFPVFGLTLANDANFYGTTGEGGGPPCYEPTLCGTVFKITPDGIFTTLHSFCSAPNCPDGYGPWGTLALAADGDLYGETLGGGLYGTTFQISTGGTLTTVYNASLQNLVQGPDGSIYGITQDDSIFRITPQGTFSILYAFCSQPNCTDGYAPVGLLLATDGNLYGTTFGGGLHNCGDYQGNGCGTVFKLTRGGVLTTLYRFCAIDLSCSDGALPEAGLVQATDGAFYGTTSSGGVSNPHCPSQVTGCGTLFKITPDGKLTTLYRFWSPRFSSLREGATPMGGLFQATNGNFYGTTLRGGMGGGGTVFSLSTGLGPFVMFIFPAGKVGRTIGILGQGFTGTTSVMLNGVPTDFNVISDTYIKATVPEDATTGYVTVTTRTGVLKSNVPFYVIP